MFIGLPYYGRNSSGGGSLMRDEPPTESGKCEECHTTEDVILSNCPYALWVEEFDDPCWLCDECYKKRANEAMERLR